MYRRSSALLVLLVALLTAESACAQVRVGSQGRGARALAVAPRGWIGISFRASDGGLTPLVEAVDPDAPADEAGIRPGDRIVSWNGRTDVIAAINSTNLQPGEAVQVRIRREGESDRDLSIVAGPRPWRDGARPGRGPMGAMPMIARADSLRIRADSLQSRLRLMLRDSLGTRMGSHAELRAMLKSVRRAPMNVRVFGLGGGVGSALAFARSGIAGAEFADVTAGLGAYFGTNKGALVLRVAPNTPAARAGLAEGDVVVRAAGQDVESVIDLRSAIADTRDDIALEILRRNERFSVTIAR